ncbi:MAG: multinuclear nonheme iron-dependent oxidase, partial [Gammaproteobacteria bacterium]
MTLVNKALDHDASIPALAGIGLRSPHLSEILEQRPNVGWFEVHSENYFGAGGASLRHLEQIRTDYPVGLHGVGLSLGSVDPLNIRHLR